MHGGLGAKSEVFLDVLGWSVEGSAVARFSLGRRVVDEAGRWGEGMAVSCLNMIVSVVWQV